MQIKLPAVHNVSFSKAYRKGALCYKPEGSGFDTRWGEFLNLPNPSGHTRPWDLLNLQQKWVPET
jgi:hypothetical protein